MEIKTLVLGALQTNCYIVSDEATQGALIIDPASDEDKAIEAYLSEKNLNPLAILITHGHFDHIGEVNHLKEKYKLPVYASSQEIYMMKDSTRNLSKGFLGATIAVQGDQVIRDGELVSIAPFEMTCIEVAGHTEESICYYFKSANVIFTGDTLFKSTVGRTDLYPGKSSDLVKNIREKLLPLPDETKVFPGHGPATSIGDEIANNYFIR